ncbi:MAG: mechanosensitive ion channel domain-containing protein [Gammaproteobacteria bacterium]
MKLIKILVCCVVLLYGGLAYSQASTFNSLAAGDALRSVDALIADQSVTYEKLSGSIERIETLQEEAKDCVGKSTGQIKEIDSLLKSTQLDEAAAKQNADYQYLKTKRDKAQHRLAECRLFLLRSQETLTAVKAAASGISAYRLLTQDIPVWTLVTTTPHDEKINVKDFYRLVSFDKARIGLVVGIMLAMIVIFLFVRFSRYLSPLCAESFAVFDAKFSKKFITRFLVVSIMIALSLSTLFLFREQEVNLIAFSIARMTFITLTAISVIWFCWLVMRLRAVKALGRIVRTFIKLTLMFLLAGILVAEWLGYHAIAFFAVQAVLSTLLLFVITWVAVNLFQAMLNYIEDYKRTASQRLHRLLGVNLFKRIPEIFLIKIVFYVLLAYFFSLMFLQIWNVPIAGIDKVIDLFMEGFSVASVHIVPFLILMGIVVYCVISILGKLFATRVAHRFRMEGEEDMQVAFATVVNYIAFIVAIIFSLLIVGVNFTGLAIIAGALSVGIGLGLQDIVNNFFSGLILLLEKPIKPGDRIRIGDTEGIVRKIRVRSTQIKTLLREDVIIPNAQLVTQQVTNYMFHDAQWRLKCRVGVAYGSDTELVKKLLLEVGAGHPDVLQTHPNEPVVLFNEFGDSALIFDLWCVIADVNKKYIILSDLHFSVDKAFREHDIVIAFPQRDLHIKNVGELKGV